ncbi:CHASE2 domain-containing protein [Oscillatoria sp. CS-180]|uniref:CHASE2 domain-containing protein n=1 Tax=Oscillatoria sp. CS-180 TaxID=3021720 RepID=UPI00232DCC1C|nr:CHASE2 domain-containing protein [Oscillatoria sp. CS-180]MDB9527599.1 CHASE2 domain-containing protein [Oscillatoria sp. CS-180]
MLPIVNYTLKELKAVFDKSWEWRIGYFLIGGFILARWLGLFSSLELITLDFFLRHRPPEPQDEHVVIVLIETDILQNSENISDGQIADLLERILSADPAVVGLNIFRGQPNNQVDRLRLVELFETHENLIGAEKAFPPDPILPMEEVSKEVVQEQFGINDHFFDQDGRIRRVVVGAYLADNNKDKSDNELKFSFSLRVAEKYLEKHQFILDNHADDPEIPIFKNSKTDQYIKLPKLNQTFGGYIRNQDIAPLQILLNFRVGKNNFEVIRSSDLQNEDFKIENLTDKAIIVGGDEAPFPQFLPVAASSNLIETSEDSNLVLRRFGITGTELEAHAASQIINKTLHGRPLIESIHLLTEDLLVILTGLGGILIGSVYRKKRTTLWNIVLLVLAIILLLIASYLLLYYFGIWLPILPASSLLAVTGIAYIAFYQSERLALEKARKLEEEAHKLLEERRKVTDRIFNSIHAGPLQTLAGVLRSVKDGKLNQTNLITDLKALNKEIRNIGENLRQEAIEDVYLADSRRDIRLELTHPMHEVFYEIYNLCLQRELPGFQKIRVRSAVFEPFDCQSLKLEDKRELCWFLQESLENVGKHATGTTRLLVTGKVREDCYTLRIEDNGPGLTSPHMGEGTKFFYRLEDTLKGRFSRISKPEGGTICKLTWSLSNKRSALF